MNARQANGTEIQLSVCFYKVLEKYSQTCPLFLMNIHSWLVKVK